MGSLARKCHFERGSAMSGRFAAAVAAMAAGVFLLSGCEGGSVNGDTTPSSTSVNAGLFQPCDKIPADAIREAGADPTTATRDVAGVQQTGWAVCRWEGSWYFLTVAVTTHTVDEAKQLSIFHDFRKVDLLGRDAHAFVQGNDGPNDNCTIAYPMNHGSVQVEVSRKGGETAREDPCATALRASKVLDMYLPR